MIRPLTMREGRDPTYPQVIWVGSVPYAFVRYVLPDMSNPNTKMPDIQIDSKY